MITFLVVLSQTAHSTIYLYDFAVHSETHFPDKDIRLETWKEYAFFLHPPGELFKTPTVVNKQALLSAENWSWSKLQLEWNLT